MLNISTYENIEKDCSSETFVKSCIFDLYLLPRANLIKWAKITNQTTQVTVSYVAQHISSVILGIPGTGTAAQGSDLADGSEIKTCSKVDQLGECKECKKKILIFDTKICNNCGSKNIKIKSDSHWIFLINSKQKLENLLNLNAIYLNLFYIENNKIKFIMWKILTSDRFIDFFNNYYFKNYLFKINNNKTPSPCNLHPFSYDFYLMSPIKIFEATIEPDTVSKTMSRTEHTLEDIDTTIDINYLNKNNNIPDKFPISLLRDSEIKDLFKEELKSLSLTEIEDKYKYLPEDKKAQLKLRNKILKNYKR